MKSTELVVGVALSIALSLFALTCTGKSPPVDAASPNLPLRTLRDIPLSGGATRFDYQSFDPNTGRLYIAHLGDSTMVVFDVNKRRRSERLRTCHECMGSWPSLNFIAFMLPLPEQTNSLSSTTLLFRSSRGHRLETIPMVLPMLLR